jgi:hypothetical protein
VVDRYNHKTGLRMSKAVFEDRWVTGLDYSADLLGWALHRGQWVKHRELASSSARALTGAESFSSTVHDIALADFKILLESTSFRIKLMICAMHVDDRRLRRALADFYGAANDWWAPVYQQILGSAGITLPADIDVPTFTILLTAIEEGLALRFLAHPESFDHNVEKVGEIFTSGALALLAGASRMSDESTTLRELVDARMARDQRRSSSTAP